MIWSSRATNNGRTADGRTEEGRVDYLGTVSQRGAILRAESRRTRTSEALVQFYNELRLSRRHVFAKAGMTPLQVERPTFQSLRQHSYKRRLGGFLIAKNSSRGYPPRAGRG